MLICCATATLISTNLTSETCMQLSRYHPYSYLMGTVAFSLHLSPAISQWEREEYSLTVRRVRQ